MANTSGEKNQRPLSPFMLGTLYKPQMTSVLSIMHRATGAALAIGTILVTVWLIAAASGEDAYNAVAGFMRGPIGTLMIFGWSVALFYHMSNGVRHLIWDTGRLFNIKHAYRAGYLVLASTVILTALAWGCAMYEKYPKDVPATTDTIAQMQIQEEAE